MKDAVAGAGCVAATFLLAEGAWGLARRLLPRERLWPRLMNTVVLSWASIVGLAILLGSVGVLSPPVLLASVSGAAVFILLALRWQMAAEPPKPGLEEVVPLVETGRVEA